MIERLERVLSDLRAGASPEDIEARLHDAVEAAREAERKDRILREVARSRNREVEECVQELSLVKEIAELLASATPEVDPIRAAVPVVREAIGADRASLVLRDAATGETTCLAADGHVGGDEAVDRTLDERLAEWVIAQAEPLIVSDLPGDGRFRDRDRDRERAPSAGSLIALPLAWSGGKPSAALVLSSRPAGFFHGRHARLLRIVGGLLASSLSGRALRDRLREVTQRMEEDVASGTAEAGRRAEDLHRRNEMITELYLSLEDAREQLEHRNDEVVRALGFSDGIVENVNVGIGVIDRDGTVLKWNRAMEQITGGQLAQEELVGRNVRDVPEALREDFGLGQDLIDALELGRFRTHTSREVALPAGYSVHVNANLLPVTGDDSGHVMIVLEDVTANIALHAQQVKAERLAAITETMVSVNHEVNNPLAVVLGRTQMLQARLARSTADDALRARLESDLALIESEAIRIQEITAKLAALIEPVVTEYPASGDVRMIDLERSR